jgi:hypothetical protein
VIAADVPNSPEWEQSNAVLADIAPWFFGGLALLGFLFLLAMVIGRVMRGPRGHEDDPYVRVITDGTPHWAWLLGPASEDERPEVTR